FQSGDEVGRIILIGLTGVVSVVIAFWLYRASNRLVAVALGLVLGGAIGNIWDRIQYGAVADFLNFHNSSWSFYVFNVADSAITLGVMLLILDALLSSQKEPT
ncbi:MAG: signal peptidase II, partial [Sphingomonadales bacterium]